MPLYHHFHFGTLFKTGVATEISWPNYAEGIRHKVQDTMMAEQRACSSNHFGIVYGLRQSHIQRILRISATTRRMAKLSRDVRDIKKGILDGLLITGGWAILNIAYSGSEIRSPRQSADPQNSSSKK